MKNRYRFLAILSVLFLGFNVAFAGRVSQEEAAAIAARFTNEQPQLSRMHKAPRQASNMRLAHKALQNNSEEVAFYVFNQEGNNGYVIVSADDRTAEDVLGYNEHGSFDYSKINPNLKWWLSRYTDEITALQTMDDSEFEQPAVRKAKQVTAIPNLLVNDQGKEITWYQETPYNNLCPTDEYDNSKCLTGCVATAASQIMYKWRWPKKGIGSSSYEWENCTKYVYDSQEQYYKCSQSKKKTLSANYGETTYDWDNMLPAYEGKSATSAQKTAVATLMYHAGVSAEMAYGGSSDQAGGSGAWTGNMAYGFITYFGYKIDKFITMYSKANYGDAHEGVPAEYSVTRDKFIEYFNADLEAGRPIIMGGEETSGGGHEFVCCGRDANNKFYINWGWEGEDNGYFALSSLSPSGYDFSSNLDAIIGLRPDKKDLPMIDITWSVDGVETTTQIMQEDPLELPADPANCESGKVFVGWTAQSSVDGEKPADLFKTAAGKTVTEAVTYYAVYATADGEGSAVDASTTFNFSEIAQAKGWENSVAYTSIEIDPVTVKAEGGGNNGKWYTSGSGSWRMYSGGTVRISVKDATLTSVTSSPACDWTISNNEATFSPSARTDFTQIVVNYTSGSGATYSEYSLSCGAAVDCELTGITLNTDNVKKTFVTGDTFTSEGLVVTANYSNCNDKNKTSKSVVTAPDMTVAGTKDVKVSYTEGDVTKEASYQITVTDPVTYTVTWSVEGEETKVVYVEGKPLALPEQTPEDCSDSRVFVGWTASNAVSDKPADLFTTASGNVNADATYYAVFATVTSGSENAAWQRVNDANSLQAGDVLVIACDSKGATAGDIDNAVMASVTTSISDGKITTMGEGTVELTLGGKKDEWTLTSSNGALGATAAKKLAWGSGTTTWQISISSEDATIQSTTSDYGRFLYNVNSPRFTTYTSNTSVSMVLPQLYRRSGGVSYEDYSLICDDEPTDVEAVQTENAVLKQLVGDQLLIIRDGQKFTVTGVHLQ